MKYPEKYRIYEDYKIYCVGVNINTDKGNRSVADLKINSVDQIA